MNILILRLRVVVLGAIVLVALTSHDALWYASLKALNPPDFPQIRLTQTANMRIVFLGVPLDYIDEGNFMSKITHSASQFSHPNNMTWNLNVSISFHEFPVEVTNSLISNAYHFEGTTYYNITLLDELFPKLENLVIPEQGYLTIFMWVHDSGVSHSWFYIQERPDLFLGRTDFFDSNPFKYWMFPSYFGGMHRVLYFDLSDVIEKTPVKTIVTDTAIRLFNNALSDVFINLLGATDSRMIAADMQRYEKYEVKILWLNGTGEQLHLERIKRGFEDLMPWTNWTITTEVMPMDGGLNDLIEKRTAKLSKPLNYSFSLANGSTVSIEAYRNVAWEVWKDSGEYDPINQYLFKHVKDYFNLTNREDKSIIPVIILQLRNDTAIGGVAGIGPSVSWFPYNVIILGYQGGTITAMGESGPMLLTHQLRHEIGHWVSLSHHSARFELGYPKVICSMRVTTDRFCAFCKDARARMSFISYHQVITELFSNSSDLLNRYGNQESLNSITNELNKSLRLFYQWDYVKSVRTVLQIYHQLEDAINEAKNRNFVHIWLIPIGITIVAITLVSTVVFIRIRMRKRRNK